MHAYIAFYPAITHAHIERKQKKTHACLMRVFPRRHIVGVNIEKKYRVIRLIAGL